MRVALTLDDVHKELIPSAGHNVQEGYRRYAKRLSMSYGVLLICQMNDPAGRYQLGNGEEQLMVPLGVEIVVPVVDVDPPGVVVGEEGSREQEHHGVSESLFDRQSHQVLHRFVKYDHPNDHQHPYLKHVRGGVEVHVLVGSDARLV